MIRQQLSDELKKSLISKDKLRLGTLRLIVATLKDKDIEARIKGTGEGIEESAILQMLQTMIKQRQDSIIMYEKGGRADLAEKEEQEIRIIQEFLPTQMSEKEVEDVLQKTAQEVGAHSQKDMGALMNLLKARYVGQMDFALAARLAKNILSA